MYVGLGQEDRAWVSRNRSTEHKKWLCSLFSDGYTLDEIVSIENKKLTKQEAMSIEKELVNNLSPQFNKLLNPDHWYIARQRTKETCGFAKALHNMGYGYTKIAFLLGADDYKTKGMSVKRMINYV
jgi:hypothetical protein